MDIFDFGALIALSFVNMYYLAPRWKSEGVRAGESFGMRGGEQGEQSVAVVVGGVYCVGFFVAYVLGPLLRKMDNG